MQKTEHIFPKPTFWLLFRIWGSIGLQSFGGGASTLFLIQHEFIDRRGWLTQEEFNHLWNLCLMTPGINLVAVTILIGRKLGGFRGIVASLVGLLLPSATITCLLTAGFRLVENSRIVQAILQGVIPATGGIMLLVGVRFAMPLLKQGKADGLPKLSVSLVLIALVACAILIFKINVPLVLLFAALAGIVFFSAAPLSSLPPVSPASSSPSSSSPTLEPSAVEEKH